MPRVVPPGMPPKTTPCTVQASKVCRKLAAAVAQLPSLRKAFYLLEPSRRLGGPEVKAVQLDTKLVLSWAPQFRRLDVGHNVSIPGLAGFVAAATALKEVELQCADEGQAAEADVVFSESKSIQSMHISGARLPCILPLGLCRLVLCLDPFDEPGTRDHMAERVMVHAMLCRLMRLPCLETLVLDMVDVTQLHSSAKLRCLGELRIVMWISGGYGGCYNLSWLKQQACVELNLVIHINSAELQQQSKLLDELQRLELELSSLKVYFCVPLPAFVKNRWEAVSTKSFERAEAFRG